MAGLEPSLSTALGNKCKCGSSSFIYFLLLMLFLSTKLDFEAADLVFERSLRQLHSLQCKCLHLSQLPCFFLQLRRRPLHSHRRGEHAATHVRDLHSSHNESPQPSSRVKLIPSIKLEKKQANKYPQVLGFELKPLISFLSEQLKWFADKGSVSSFVIRLKEAGSTTELFCSQDLFVFSAHSEASKCCVSIIGTVFSRLPIASFMAVYLRILLSSAHIHEIHLVRGHYTATFKRSGKN